MNRSTLTPTLTLFAIGTVFFLTGAKNLSHSDQLASTNNPFGIYRSAYGKLLARLGETTIDRVWHLGIEQIVPHYMSGNSHGASGASLSDPENQLAAKETPRKPIVESAK
ncbi:MAG: hypothetical protein AAF357_12340, partial [Verrucomicrobiota bacterium]